MEQNRNQDQNLNRGQQQDQNWQSTGNQGNQGGQGQDQIVALKVVLNLAKAALWATVVLKV